MTDLPDAPGPAAPPLGARLARARAAHRLGVGAVAAAVGVAPHIVMIWEAGLEPPPGAAVALRRWLDAVEAGRPAPPRVVPQFALCEERRRAAAGFATLHRELARAHRALLTANEDNDEQLLFAHESYHAALDSADSSERARLAHLADDRLAAVGLRLEDMSRRLAYLRDLTRSAMAARAAGRRAA